MVLPSKEPNVIGGIKGLLPIIVPFGSVVVTVLGLAISFTKVQMESTLHAAQITSLETRIDRFQIAFDVFRAESNKDNRDRDRLIERATATNEAQNARLDQLIAALRRMDDIYRMPNARPQNYTPFLDLDNAFPAPVTPSQQEATNDILYDRSPLPSNGEVHASARRTNEQ